METVIKTRIVAGFAYAQVEAHESSVRFGYWSRRRDLIEAIALMHKDASKALEIATLGDGPSEIKDITRMEEALADIIIRCLDISGGKNLCVAAAVVSKLEHNEQLSKLVKKDF